MEKEFKVEKQGDKLVWLVRQDVPFNTELTVHKGCLGIVVTDGMIFDERGPGVYPLNIKKIFHKPDFNIWSVYGVNVSEVFELPFGCQVKYTEKVHNVVVTIKASGECCVKIENGSKFFSAFNLISKEGTTKKDLEEKFRNMLICEAESAIAEVANMHSDFAKIEEAKNKMSDMIKDKLTKKLQENYGLRIQETIIRINEFEGLKEIWSLQQEKAKSGIEKEVAENRGAIMESIAKGVNAFNKTENAKEPENKNSIIDLMSK